LTVFGQQVVEREEARIEEFDAGKHAKGLDHAHVISSNV
jgi:hypothetical protein